MPQQGPWRSGQNAKTHAGVSGSGSEKYREASIATDGRVEKVAERGSPSLGPCIL